MSSSSSDSALSGLSIESSDAQSDSITPEYNPAAAREALAVQEAIASLDAMDFDFWAPWSESDRELTDDEEDFQWLLLEAELGSSNDEDDVSWEGDDEEEEVAASEDDDSDSTDGADELNQELVDIFADEEDDAEGFDSSQDGDTDSGDDAGNDGDGSSSDDKAGIPGAKCRRRWW
jgi:hypothetical protein